ncbi:hypothetical protein BDU57DRAFT_80476 [Ampelomyces quisqualis]|uniref:Uncharacterized protein n=1 Tax=Ampelomyces quisqualis TaxID=50730 RepID=A0A6A5QCD2_AMPQU|nr:hypothetical protein BDU57DRAFT_80476 [Ampelomyces quisqualis]
MEKVVAQCRTSRDTLVHFQSTSERLLLRNKDTQSSSSPGRKVFHRAVRLPMFLAMLTSRVPTMVGGRRTHRMHQLQFCQYGRTRQHPLLHLPTHCTFSAALASIPNIRARHDLIHWRTLVSLCLSTSQCNATGVYTAPTVTSRCKKRYWG